jgi:hypothetical protein
MSALDLIEYVRGRQRPVRFIVITGFGTTRDAVAAMRLGAADFLEKPVFEEDLLYAIRASISSVGHDAVVAAADGRNGAPAAHAAARWARVIVPLVDSPTDPRTISAWGRLVYASPGALRNWCRLAGISPRRSLVFARIFRAVVLGDGGKHKPENLLDVGDRRTLAGLFRLAGLNPYDDFPRDVDAFLQHQTLIRDPDTLGELKVAFAARRAAANRKGSAPALGQFARASTADSDSPGHPLSTTSRHLLASQRGQKIVGDS